MLFWLLASLKEHNHLNIKETQVSGTLRTAALCLLTTLLFTCNALAATDAAGNKSIRIAIDDNYPPYIFRGSTGELQGYLVDLWRLWERKTGIHVVLLASDWADAQRAMETGKADVLETAFSTPQRESAYDFAPPYADIPVAIYADANIGGITDTGNLRGFQVGVKAGDACADRLRSQGIATLVESESYESLVNAALSGRIRVFCLDEPPANYLLYREGADRRFRKAFSLYTGQLHRAVHKGDRTTLERVTRGFDAISSDELSELEDKWKGQSLERATLGRYIGWTFLAIVGVAALLALWTLSLRRKVRLRTRELDEERTHLRTLIEALPDAIWLKDRGNAIVAANPAYERLIGRSIDDIVGRRDDELFPREQAEIYRAGDQRALAEGEFHIEESYKSRRLEITKKPVLGPTGSAIGILGIAHDITARERDKEALQRSLRSLRLLSEVSQTLIRCESEKELLDQLTSLVVDIGGFLMACVGYARDDAERTVEPVAQAGGGHEYLGTRRISWGDNEFGQTVSGRAIRSRQAIVNRDFSGEDMRPWRDAAKRQGYGSSIALPLLSGDAVYGVLNIYAAEKDAFAAAEVELLGELAGDLGYGIRTLRQRLAHDQAVGALRGQKEVLELVATGATLETILDTLLRNLESQSPGMLGSILLVDSDGQHLRHGAAPSLPDSFSKAVDGIAVGPLCGCCGAAAYRGEKVIVEDIAQDAATVNYRELAASHGLRACWSTPFFNLHGDLLGTLACYFREPRRPEAGDLHRIDLAVQTAGIAVTRKREEEALRRSEASLSAAQALAGFGNWEIDLASGRLYWSLEMYRLHYLSPSDTPPSIKDQKRLIHPDDAQIRRDVWRKIRISGSSQRYEFRTHPSLGPVRYLSGIIEPVTNEAGVLTSYVGTVQDITERKAQEAEIERLAFYDSLTGLPHRALFIDRLQQALSTAERRGSAVALLFLDLDRFKEINDSQGHEAGDKVLIEVGQRLQAILRHGETLARLGGDEFTVIVSETDNTTAARVAERIQSAFVRPFTVGGRTFTLGISIGIALYPADGDSVKILLSNSDIAMYQAKSNGGGYHFYSREMSVQLDSRLSLAQGLERAIAENRLQLHYQPQIGLADGRLVGAEALLRWQDDARGWISPAEFIPVAESRGMMDILGAWVLREAARQLQTWGNQGLAFCGTLAINVSAKQLDADNFVATTCGIMETFGIDPRQIELELTESALMIDADKAVELMAGLKERGFALAIDDFGTGYSSLIYLKRFPADKLKIDISFVRDMLSDNNDHAIVTTIIAMARNLGLKTVAEGVENQDQVDALKALGCDEAQGYHCGAPVPAAEFADRWLGRQN